MEFLNPKKVISSASVFNGSIAVDFGFGTGGFLEYLSVEVGKEGRVYAIDIQKDIVKKVSEEFRKKNITNTKFLTANLENDKSTQMADSSVDFVLISGLFFQLHLKENVLKEAMRILKPGGRLLFIE
jgi:arsenite methyltransferase